MKFHILTLFPEMVEQGLRASIIGRALERRLIALDAVNIRDYTQDRHGKTDDYTYGGGAGMLMQAQPVYDAYQSVCGGKKLRTVYVTPQGVPFHQAMAEELAAEEELVILCGHYEGVDERVLEEIVTDYVSIGDYVLTGGELAAMVIVDAVSRLVPGVLGNEASADMESFHKELLEYPQYSRPEEWHGKAVPEVLLSGNHSKIAQWRLEQAKLRTRRIRPDLYEKYLLREEVVNRLRQHKRDYIHIMECLSRGAGEILSASGDNILVYQRYFKMALITVESEEAGEKLLGLVPGDTEFVVTSQEFMNQPVCRRFSMKVEMECVQACYTNREKLPVKHRDIRPLSLEELDYVAGRYPYAGREYIRKLILKKLLYGAYVEDRLVGFAGEHGEGSIGLLFVEPGERGRGIGSALEAFMINRHRDLGYTPFGQIAVDNRKSLELQRTLGLYLSEGHVWWLGR